MDKIKNLNVKTIVSDTNIKNNINIDKVEDNSYVVDRDIELFLDSCELGNLELVKKILDKDIDVSKPYMHKFLINFNKSKLKKLLSFGDSEEKRFIVVKYNSILDAALRFSIECGNYDIVYYLLNTYNDLDNLNEAFVSACQKNNLTIVRRLVENYNVNLMNSYGDFERVIDGGLYYARNSKATEVYRYLIKLNTELINNKWLNAI